MQVKHIKVKKSVVKYLAKWTTFLPLVNELHSEQGCRWGLLTNPICILVQSQWLKSLRPGSHMCSGGSQHGFRSIPVHQFRYDSGPNVCLNLDLNWTQRCTEPFWNVVSPDLCELAPLRARHTRMACELDGGGGSAFRFAHMWTGP